MAESAKKIAKDIIVVKVGPETPVKEVAKLMLACDISGFPVVDDQGKVIGVVTELDLMRNQIAPNEPSIWSTIWGMDAERMKKYQDARRKYMAKTAGEVMTSPALTVDVAGRRSYDFAGADGGCGGKSGTGCQYHVQQANQALICH